MVRQFSGMVVNAQAAVQLLYITRGERQVAVFVGEHLWLSCAESYILLDRIAEPE
jgi:hypothetical protein